MTTKPMGLLFDMVACGGCRKCVKACQESHDFKGNPDTITELSATAYTAMRPHGDNFIRTMCRHCSEPSCASVCPVSALYKTELGPVVYDASKCMGCRYCMVACPFDVPKYEWDNPVPAVRKCNMCYERLQKGEVTACAKACPNEATVVGPRDELIAEARRRIRENPKDYYDHIYGERELGGTSVLFITPFPVETLGFGRGPGESPLPTLTWQVLQKIPGVVTIGGAALLGIYWITQRRDEVAHAEAAEVRPAKGTVNRKEESDHAR